METISSLTKYKYYDSPDGHDCFQKMIYTGKMSGLAAIVVASLDVVYNSHPKGYRQTAIRYGYFLFPMVGIATTFTAITCMATSLRKKDDHLNYILGGMSAGGVFGVWMRSTPTGCIAALALAGLGALKKDSIMKGFELFPLKDKKNYGNGNIWLNTCDFTISKDPRF